MKFMKLYPTLLEQDDLTPNQVVVLTYIYDRFSLSQQNISFYDKEKNERFVIFTYQELKKRIHLSNATLHRIFKALKKYIYFELKNNRVNLIYLTDFSKKLLGYQNKKQAYQNERPVYQKDIPVSQNDRLVKQNITKQNNNIKLVSVLKDKLHLSNKIIKILQEFTHNNEQQIYKIVGILLKAKNHAKFEDITTIKKLEDNLYSILSKSSESGNFEHVLFNELHKLFINHRIENIPSWMKPDYQPVEMSLNEIKYLKAESQKLLDKLNHKSLSCVN